MSNHGLKAVAEGETKYVYAFQDGDGHNKKLLGGKGANLCEMTQIGLNVPPGFVISTDACLAYLDTPARDLPAGLMGQVRQEIEALEQATGKGFGDAGHPLLVSVRSGSAHVHAGHDGHHSQSRPEHRIP